MDTTGTRSHSPNVLNHGSKVCIFAWLCFSLLIASFCHHYLIDTRLPCLDFGNNSNVQRWAKMAKLIPSRSANEIKNKWYYTVRKDTRLSQIGSNQPHKLDTTAVTTDNSSLSIRHPPAIANAQTAPSSTSSTLLRLLDAKLCNQSPAFQL